MRPAPPPNDRARAGAPQRPWGSLHTLTLGAPLTSSVSVLSRSVPRGGRVTFEARGFTPRSTLRVYLDYDRAHELAQVQLDDGGNGGDVTRVQIPALSRVGQHTLTFDDGSRDVDLLIEITPSLGLARVVPTAVLPGATVMFTGSGFPARSVVSIKLDGDGDPQTCAAADDGSIAGQFTLPVEVDPGQHELRFLAHPAVSTIADFRVDEPAAGDTITR